MFVGSERPHVLSKNNVSLEDCAVDDDKHRRKRERHVRERGEKAGMRDRRVRGREIIKGGEERREVDDYIDEVLYGTKHNRREDRRNETGERKYKRHVTPGMNIM